MARFLAGADLWPLTLVMLLLLRLERLSRRLQEISDIVERQSQAIEHLREETDLAPASAPPQLGRVVDRQSQATEQLPEFEEEDLPPASAPPQLGRVVEDHNADMVQSRSGHRSPQGIRPFVHSPERVRVRDRERGCGRPCLRSSKGLRPSGSSLARCCLADSPCPPGKKTAMR